MSHKPYDLRSLTPTICKLMGIAPPYENNAPPLEIVTESAQRFFAGETVERILIYNPDAVGKVMYDRYREDFIALQGCAPFKVELRSVLPPKTPVCFASMYTGVSPQEHGTTKYEKPVLQIDTLFDALLRAEKKWL